MAVLWQIIARTTAGPVVVHATEVGGDEEVAVYYHRVHDASFDCYF